MPSYVVRIAEDCTNAARLRLTRRRKALPHLGLRPQPLSLLPHRSPMHSRDSQKVQLSVLCEWRCLAAAGCKATSCLPAVLRTGEASSRKIPTALELPLLWLWQSSRSRAARRAPADLQFRLGAPCAALLASTMLAPVHASALSQTCGGIWVVRARRKLVQRARQSRLARPRATSRKFIRQQRVFPLCLPSVLPCSLSALRPRPATDSSSVSGRPVIPTAFRPLPCKAHGSEALH